MYNSIIHLRLTATTHHSSTTIMSVKLLRPKLLIIGHAGSGKDTVCEYLAAKHGYDFVSTSFVVAREVIYPSLSHRYETVEQCYEDRSNNRKEWFDIIKAHNTPDSTNLARKILETNDIYCGMRNCSEVQACKDAGLFDVVIWIHRTGIPEESEESCTVTNVDSDYTLVNDSCLDTLYLRVDHIARQCVEKTFENLVRKGTIRLTPLVGLTYNVLDHGIVQVIDYMGGDQSIVDAARTSYGKGTRSSSSSRDLIHYLWRNKHTTPFEMCEITFFLRLPIFVARQLIRHRTASINEYSMRYSEAQDIFYCPDVSKVGLQSMTNRQGREEVSDATLDIRERFCELTKRTAASSLEQYEIHNDMGVSRELNRINLPVSGYTQMYWKIDLKNLLHFLRLRMDSHAQYEIRVYADAMAEVVRQWCPITWHAFEEYTLYSVEFSRKELLLLKRVVQDHKAEITKPSNFSFREWEEFKIKRRDLESKDDE